MKQETILIHKKYIPTRIRELIEEIKNMREDYYEKIYTKLYELYHLKKKLNPKYTFDKLAQDTGSNPAWVYRIMSWRKATNRVKELVSQNRISMRKACRIISKVPKFRQDEDVKNATDNNLTDDEIDKYITKKRGIEKQKIIENREYKNEWNIARDLMRYCTKIKRSLLVVQNIPKNKREEVLNSLKKLKISLTTAIRKLE